MKGDELGGYHIPPKAAVFLNFYSVHRDEIYWENPLEFNPDRFEKQPKLGTYLPFSIGPRKCIGFMFSLIEGCLVLAKILQEYTVHFTPDVDPKTYVPKDDMSVAHRPKDLKLIFKRRV